jgi:glycerol-3-phosphate O-acyltransferase / dihydroxyacetone phosphate acyltransferase
MQWTRIITRALGGTAAIFQTVEQSGAPVPDGPVLVIANHPNALLDPLVIFRVAGRPTRPLAKAPLFEQKFVGTLLRALGGLPVYRAADDATQMHHNEDTFRGAIAALQAGDAVQIYPEGKSHSEPGLAALRTGAARIVFGAEAGAGWQLGLRIVPIGLTFYHKALFRGRVLALIGESFTIDGYRAAYEADPVKAVRALTEEMTRRLADVTVNTSEPGDIELIDTAERLYTREKGVAGFRERDPLAARVPRLQAFARGLEWLRAHDADRFRNLARAVRRYRRRAEWLGAVEGDAPPRYAPAAVASWIVMKALLLLVTAPIAIIGTAIWYPTYVAPRLTLRLVRPDIEAVATYKLATGFVMVPLTVVVCSAIAGLVAGWTAAAATLALVPALGFAAMAWHDRRARAMEDAALFLRLAPQREHRQRQARDRAQLTAEFDALIEEAGILEAASAQT